MKPVLKSKDLLRVSKRESKLKKKISSTSIRCNRRVKECENLQQDPKKNVRCLKNRGVSQVNSRFEQSLNGKIRKASENCQKTLSENNGDKFTWHEIFLNGGCKFVKQVAIKKTKKRHQLDMSLSWSDVHRDFVKVFETIKQHASRKEKKFLELKRDQFEDIYFELAGIAPRNKEHPLLETRTSSDASVESKKEDVPSTKISFPEARQGLKGGDNLRKSFRSHQNCVFARKTKTVRFFKADQCIEDEKLSVAPEIAVENRSFGSFVGKRQNENVAGCFDQEMKRELASIENMRESKITMPEFEEPSATVSNILLLELQRKVHQSEDSNVQSYEGRGTNNPKDHTYEKAVPRRKAENNQTSESPQSKKETLTEVPNGYTYEKAVPPRKAENNQTSKIIQSNKEDLKAPKGHTSETAVPRKKADNNQNSDGLQSNKEILAAVPKSTISDNVFSKKPFGDNYNNIDQSLSLQRQHEPILPQNGYESNRKITKNPEISFRSWENDILAKISPLKEVQIVKPIKIPEEFEQKIRSTSENQCDGQALLRQLEKLLDEIKVGLTDVRKKLEDKDRQNPTIYCASESNDHTKKSREDDTLYPSFSNSNSWKAYSFSKHQREMSSCDLGETLALTGDRESGVSIRKQKNIPDGGFSLPEFTGCPCMLEMFAKVSEAFQNISIQESKYTQKE